MAKVHLRVNKLTGSNQPIPACGSKSHGDKIKRNLRNSRTGDFECLGYDDWSTRGDDRCMLCDFEVERINNKRVSLGLRSWL